MYNMCNVYHRHGHKGFFVGCAAHGHMLLVALHMVTPQITRATFDRPNLYLEVRRKKETFWDSIQPLVKGVGFPGSTIIYCLRKREVEMVAEELQEQGLKVAMYNLVTIITIIILVVSIITKA